VPDKRTHRGRHPEDLVAFAPENEPRLRAAVADFSWLLSRGYAEPSALKVVGDRYNLRERQRIAVMRCACSDDSLVRRRQHGVGVAGLKGQVVLLDGYNVLTTVETALAGGIVIVGRDGCYRDMASMHGTFRRVTETLPAVGLLGSVLHELGVAKSLWYLDRPVSNSGRLKTVLLQVAGEHDWDWQVHLVPNPDAVLSSAPDIVASADSVVLDQCGRWFGLAREVVNRRLPQARIISLQP